jgi:hypothetical protein
MVRAKNAKRRVVDMGLLYSSLNLGSRKHGLQGSKSFSSDESGRYFGERVRSNKPVEGAKHLSENLSCEE